MSNSFYGNFIRDKFPLKSKVRLEEDSNGAKLFNAIGSEIEAVYRRKVFAKNTCQYISSKKPLNNLGTIYRLNLVDDSTYTSSVLSEEVDTVTNNNSIQRSKTLEEFYNSDPTDFNLVNEETITTLDPLIKELVNVKNNNETYNLKKEEYIYINVKKIGATEDEAKPSSTNITIRGLDKNLNPLEETIAIRTETMYRSMNRFLILKPISENQKYNVAGGPAISVSDLKTFEIEILRAPCKNWLEDQVDYREVDVDGELEVIKIKRLEIQSFVSKPKFSEINLEGALADNFLTVELCSLNNKSKFRYIHRHFDNITAYRNELNNTDDSDYYNLEERIIEQVLGETYLVDSNNNYINAVDFDYNIVDGRLYVLSDKGDIYLYDVGVAECAIENAVFRTYNPGIRLDVLEEHILDGETCTVRIVNTSLDSPLNNFFIGKRENGVTTFLNADKTAFENEINLFSPLSNIENLQDTLETFSFDIPIEKNNVEIFVICLNNNAQNKLAISQYSNDENATIYEFLRSLDIQQANTKTLISSIVKPPVSFSGVYNLQQGESLKYLYFDGTDRGLRIVNNANSHYKFLPEYNTFYYSDNAIFTTQNVSGVEYTFRLMNGEEVIVNG